MLLARHSPTSWSAVMSSPADRVACSTKVFARSADKPTMSPVTQTLQPLRCDACKDGVEPPFPFTMAFQPIVDTATGAVFAYEALVRGPQNQPAGEVLAQLTPENLYSFDQNCRVRAIELAARLGLAATGARLSINFMPGAVYSPAACIQLTLRTARELHFPVQRLIFEITEAEQVRDKNHLAAIVTEYRKHGFRLALDDFGAGYSSLNLFASVTTDIIKLDMELTRDLHLRPTAIAVVKSVVALAGSLGTQIVAEGIETVEEYEAVRSCGIHLMQGYLFARPAFEALPEVTLPSRASVAALHPIPTLSPRPEALFPILFNTAAI